MFIGNLNSIGNLPIGGSSFTNEKSLLFDGVDEYVETGDVAEIKNATNFSWSAWVKIPSATSGIDIFMGRYASTTNGIWVGVDSSLQWQVAVYNGGTAQNYFADTISTGQWYHVVMVYDGTQGTATDRVKLYVDGVSLTRSGGLGTLPASTSNTIDGFHIGSVVGTGTTMVNPFNGYVDEVAIFDYSLDATQASSLYNSGVPTDLDNTSGVTAPVHWWRCGDASDTISTIYDVGTSASNNGVPQNMESGDIVSDTP